MAAQKRIKLVPTFKFWLIFHYLPICGMNKWMNGYLVKAWGQTDQIAKVLGTWLKFVSPESSPWKNGVITSGSLKYWSQETQIEAWKLDREGRKANGKCAIKQVTNVGSGNIIPLRNSGRYSGECLRVTPAKGQGSWGIYSQYTSVTGWWLLPGSINSKVPPFCINPICSSSQRKTSSRELQMPVVATDQVCFSGNGEIRGPG